jgi:hypothetical protein
MATEATAVFNHMSKCSVPDSYGGYYGAVARHLHEHLLAQFRAAVTITCIANLDLAVPHEPVTAGVHVGHVTAMLVRTQATNQGMFVGGLMVEATRQASPYTAALSTFLCGGQRVFTRVDYDYSNPEGAVCTMKPFNPDQYYRMIAAQTHDATFYCITELDGASTLSAKLDDLLAGTNGAHVLPIVPPADAAYSAASNRIAHHPRYEQIDAHIAANAEGVCCCIGYRTHAGAGTPSAVLARTHGIVFFNPAETAVGELVKVTEFCCYRVTTPAL